MALLETPLEQVTESDLQRLIEAGAAESLYIDYKQQGYGDKESDHVEFLADVSSFANTSGGDLIIGMSETGGIPDRLVPLVGDIDFQRRRLEDIARTGLEPRIQNLRTHPVPLAQGGHVLIVRVPRSYSPPHRVTYRNRSRFWARASSGKYEPNVEELRRIFTEAPQLAERIRSFRLDRIARIAAGDTPIPMPRVGKVALHMVPLPSFSDGRLIDVVSVLASGTHVPLPLDGMSGGNQSMINFDGYLNYADHSPRGRVSYAQFFRSGAVESVGELGRTDQGNPYFAGPEFANRVMFAVRQHLEVLRTYDTGLPIYVLLSLCGVNECYFRHAPEGFWTDVGPLRRDVIFLPEVYIENFGTDPALAMRPAFNVLWNAFGFIQCDMYNAQGAWIGTA